MHNIPRGSRYLRVELSGISLRRGGRAVLRNLQWSIQPGERWVLLGANGAGKTQLLKLLAGDVWPQPGPRTRRQYRQGRDVHDEPQLVREQIAYLGPERQDRYEHYGWNHRVATIVGTGLQHTDIPLAPLRAPERLAIARLLRRLGLAPLAGRRFLTLSYGERRLVLLARALASRPRLLLLDEPLTGLDGNFRERMRRALGALRRSRLPWVYATHRLEDVPAGVTHVAELARGSLQTRRWRNADRARGAARDATYASARAAAVAGMAPRRARPGRAPAPASPLLRMHAASVWRAGVPVLQQVTWQVNRGECWVVHGANGSGKSTLLGALYGEFGVDDRGSLWRRGQAPGMPLEDFQRGVGRVAPELQAALPRYLGTLECVVGGLRSSHGLDGAATAAELRHARRALRRVGALSLAPRALHELSYGQMRRVLFARALVRDPAILLLDEPYAGLDERTRAQLRALVESWLARGRTLVIATHHRDEWPRSTTHELLLVAGQVRRCGPLRPQVTSPAR